MFSAINNTSPKFEAHTTIKVSDDILSKENVKTLTKMGKKIGTNADRINFSVRNHNDDLVMVSHKSQFDVNGTYLEIKNMQVLSKTKNRVYEYIKSKLDYIQSLYPEN